LFAQSVPKKTTCRFDANLNGIAVKNEISEISGSANVHKRMKNIWKLYEWNKLLNMTII